MATWGSVTAEVKVVKADFYSIVSRNIDFALHVSRLHIAIHRA
jgi:hypothetical protein